MTIAFAAAGERQRPLLPRRRRNADVPETIASGQSGTGDPVEFLLDACDCIETVNPSWDAFARANGAPELAGAGTIGKPLLSFVSGNVTRRFTQALLERTRRDGREIGIDYRCDSPEFRRYMRMSATPLTEGRLRLAHRETHIERRAHPLYFVTAEQRERDIHVRCSLCNRLKYRGAWVEGESAWRESGLALFRVIYGVCPACESVLDALDLDIRA